MEVLIVIAIIGIVTLIALPLLTEAISAGKVTVAKRNAQHTVSVSSKLSSVGVAHVLPESLGGTEATSRLLRRGIVVPDGPMQGAHFTIGEISDENIAAAAVFMEILFEFTELRLGYNPSPEP